MLRKEKGVTLVALAVTIIVLLILAAISMRALDANGIFSQATNASSLYSSGSSAEAYSLQYIQSSLDSLSSSISVLMSANS